MLTHTGRKSGKRRHVVVEVVDHDKVTDTYYVASGWGEKSDWFQNIQKNPDTIIHVGRYRFATVARRLSVDEGEERLAVYARKHPFAFRELSSIMLGERVDPTADGARRVADKVPIIAFRLKTIS
jgi:deazaflavin-dependent oxidoreductase (nitroreductase family)